MLDKRKIRMLQLLDKQIDNCNLCDLKYNGCAIPFWTESSKYVIIGEAPGYNEIRQKKPFVGAAGEILQRELVKEGFKSKDFLIINTVQCRPVIGGRNGKPSEHQIKTCQSYLRKYIKIINPEKIICLGNYAKYIFTGNIQGVLRQRGEFNKYTLDGDSTKYDVLFTIHPAYCIYNQEDGIPILQEDIKTFKELKVERINDWFLSESDFLV